jgi:molybdenum cofactor guanylyltransferase
MRIFGVILAGGTAQRMGGADKALMLLAGEPLISHVKARLDPQVEALAISANGPADRFNAFSLTVLRDDATIGSRGPLSGVLAAMHWAQVQGATHVVSAAVDTPFLPCDLVPQLCLAGEAHADRFAIARAAGRDHPTFGLWPVALYADLHANLSRAGSARVLGFVDAHHAARADFSDPGLFSNLNTPQDLAEAESRIASAR